MGLMNKNKSKNKSDPAVESTTAQDQINVDQNNKKKNKEKSTKKVNGSDSSLFNKKDNNIESEQKEVNTKPKQKVDFKKSDLVTWNYAHDADVTFGETKQSKTARIILIVILVLLAGAIGVSIYFKDFILDYISNPHVLLLADEVELEVFDEFIPENYVVKDSITDDIQITFPAKEDVNVNKLGTYSVIYTSVNNARVVEEPLLIHIVDKTAPIIKLSQSAVIMDKEESETFDANQYIKEMSDNYDKPEDLILTLSGASIDWTKQNNEIEYTVKDTSGNIAHEILNIVIIQKPEDETPTVHEHSWDEGKVIKEATNDESGIRQFTCTECGETYEEDIPQLVEPTESAHEHIWDDGVIIQEATTEQSGVRRYTCTECGEIRDESIPPLPTEPAHEHTWDGGIVIQEATTSNPGVRRYTCTGCGATYDEGIPQLPPETQPPHTHSWNSGVIIQEATTDHPGVRRYTCTGCGATYDEGIPQLPKPTEPAVFINGVHDVRIPVGTDLSTFQQQLITGVYGSGYVSVDFSQVNLTVPGTYTATFSCDGLVKTCTVTVYE